MHFLEVRNPVDKSQNNLTQVHLSTFVWAVVAVLVIVVLYHVIFNRT